MTKGAVEVAKATTLWIDQLESPVVPRPPLPGDIDVDVAIVGGGFSGLWTAYYLIRHDPSLRIAVLEREYCGFGASGRNGGWCIGELAGSFAKYAKLSNPGEALRQARAVFDTVDEVGRVAALEGIDCDFAKGGTVRLARNAPQAKRQADEIAEARSQGFTKDEIRLLSAAEARSMLNATEVRSGVFFAATAALQPAKLVRGLASVVEAAGVKIFEQTPVASVEDRVVRTARGRVKAQSIVRATEAYTRDLVGERRTVLPVYSFMIATEPLPEELFAEIGLANRSTFADDRYMVIYGQRTGDNRLAFGGTGVPYLWSSGISEKTEFDLESHGRVHDVLVDLLPSLANTTITHRWGGVLAIPRNWVPGLTYDQDSGLGAFGGYVGEGVAASNLAGRTMADLITRQDTPRVSLPWVGAKARRWEPEPLRFIGVRSSRKILAAADASEFGSDEEAKMAFQISRILRGAWTSPRVT
ncbi:MAG: FAD-dependent oxidoreductase [Acidimicrobiales bacterium]|nr:FAD-dependent oxidoreductase [Acidimicrobiales bacterium]